ncbi:pyridoxamine 5'-phosphate oxidase family protein [Fimbriimonas ginsengisoli]|nr:pyridoxamine 5'-phosphate oxidase family protein [Fimbriimonas ginsengisoli]
MERLLLAAPMGRIGCHSGGRTYIVPISFAYDGRRILAHTPEGRKVEMMRENPDVCFEVDEVIDLVNWRSIIAWGRFKELKDADAAVAMGLLFERLRPLVANTSSHGHALTPPSRAVSGASMVVFAIELTEMTGRYERQEP